MYIKGEELLIVKERHTTQYKIKYTIDISGVHS
jgi:hypothetical protein